MLLQIAMQRMIVIIMHATARIRNMIMVLTLEFLAAHQFILRICQRGVLPPLTAFLLPSRLWIVDAKIILVRLLVLPFFQQIP